MGRDRIILKAEGEQSTWRADWIRKECEESRRRREQRLTCIVNVLFSDCKLVRKGGVEVEVSGVGAQ